MNNFKTLGLFSDLPYGDPNQLRLVDAKERLSVSAEQLDKIIKYLSEARLVAVSPGLSKDVLTGSIIGTGGFQTDEVWTWHADLPYYVKQHRVELPQEFLLHLQQKAVL